MNNIRAIRTEEDYEAALARIEELFDAEESTSEEEELNILVDLVTVYEDLNYPIGPPEPIAAIEFRMEQAGLTARDLVPFIGSRAKVSEVLSGKRGITMPMARALHQHLGIPAEALLQESGSSPDSSLEGLDPRRFPLKAMAKAKWIANVPNIMEQAEGIVADLVRRAGGPQAAHALYRKNDDRRINAKTDEYSLKAWCLQVMAKAREHAPDSDYEPGTVTPDLLREVAKLSTSKDGPRRAKAILAERGISLEHLRHLPKTHLDGAALRLTDGRPVIGLTIRYDRIDNFWFTLLHELAHVGLHMDGDNDGTGFIDDHSLRNVEAPASDSLERDADLWAQDALIPPELWRQSLIKFDPSPMSVIELAVQAGVHPAVVAGRVRREMGNYRLLSQFVGSGEVRRQFEGNQ